MQFDLREYENWLTPREVAKRLNCTPEAIRLRIRRGRLGTKVLGRLMVSKAEVETLKIRKGPGR